MSFTDKLWANITNCYVNDPGFFWEFIMFLVIFGCGIYLTIVVYRSIFGRDNYIEFLFMLMVCIASIIVNLPLVIVAYVLEVLGIKISTSYMWTYLPIPIVSTYVIKKILNRNSNFRKSERLQDSMATEEASPEFKPKKSKFPAFNV